MSGLERGATPFVVLDQSRCDACWDCVEVCPESVLRRLDLWFHRHAKIQHGERCIGCRACVKVCPAGALSDRRAAASASRHHDTEPAAHHEGSAPP